jgi:hypothetical protein
MVRKEKYLEHRVFETSTKGIEAVELNAEALRHGENMQFRTAGHLLN